MDKVVNLIVETITFDSYGRPVTVETTKSVYAVVSSVSASEWFEGGRNGLNPEYRLTMFKYEYGGESIVEIDNVRYTIYRTYEKQGDMIELYCEKRKGNE